MTPNAAVKLAVENIVADGFDDVLPTPVEVELLRKDPRLKEQLKAITLDKINSYLNSKPSRHSLNDAFDRLSLSPISHILVPKKDAFDYRKIAILSPQDLAVYQAISVMIGEPFEKARTRIARGRLFSYRFKPVARKGRLFSPTKNYRSFQTTSARISRHASVKYITKSDIANFYDRVNIHRIESTLRTTKGLDNRVIDLINQMLLHWAKRDSYGLPVGSNASRILAEVALFNVDISLADAGIKFLRFVDDFRIFTKTATEAHSALAMLIELLDREGLFINARKSSIERLDVAKPESGGPQPEHVRAERIKFKEFRIFSGYGGTIPIKFRTPSEVSHQRHLEINLIESIRKIHDDDFAQPEQLRDVLFAMIAQEKYNELVEACDLVEMFPQFYPLFVDILVKNSGHIPEEPRRRIIERFDKMIGADYFLSDFIKASLIRLIGHRDFFDRDAVMRVIRNLHRNAGVHLGRVVFEAAQNLEERGDALEIRGYFERSNEWERRRIISLMSTILPEQEYRAWQRSIRTYVSKDPFALALK